MNKKPICSDETLEKRFLAKITIPENKNECWKWTGATYPYGYGCIGTSKGLDGAHRVSYRLYKGEIPDGMCVLHKCDNPNCNNPEHLFLGTKKDNAIDRNSKGRGKNPVHRGNHPLSKLKVEDVMDIKRSSDATKVLATKYGVNPDQISRIKRGERWGWL
jgi:hypothetical protein